jgi:hypothetical protein
VTSGLRRRHLRLVLAGALLAALAFIGGLSARRPEPLNDGLPAGLQVDQDR